MNFKLNNEQIAYILYHINFYFELNDSINDKFVFGGEDKKKSSGIYFPLSGDALDENNIKIIKNIPVLFPLNSAAEFYFIEDGNVYFNDDLFKSAFYLLSGYQETLPYKGDSYGRFSYEESIQKRLKIAEVPLVNIYFKVICSAVEEYCKIHDLPFSKRRLWGDKPFALMLTHDVDRVDKYTIHKLKNTIKQTFKNKQDVKSRIINFKMIFSDLMHLAAGENPYWNFEWLKKIERKYDFKSTWFFLPKGQKHRDAYYSFKEKRIQNLINFLQKEGDEIGLHGTYNSRLNNNILKRNYKEITALIGTPPLGIRQHWLSFTFPQTLILMESLDLRYDSSWGFADHIGWRNSYCLPFRPWDFKNNRIMNLWEFPLGLMDVTLFEYQKMDMDKARLSINRLINEIIKYNGLLVALWHNSLDEENVKGIIGFYKDFLKKIAQKNPKIVLPSELINLFNKVNNNEI